MPHNLSHTVYSSYLCELSLIHYLIKRAYRNWVWIIEMFTQGDQHFWHHIWDIVWKSTNIRAESKNTRMQLKNLLG